MTGVATAAWAAFRRRPWVYELILVVAAVAVWWLAIQHPAQARKTKALEAYDAYAQTRAPQWRRDRDVVEHEGSSYLVCSRRDDADRDVVHYCLDIDIDNAKAKRVIGGYRLTSIGVDLPEGTKSACFGFDKGACLDQ